jgi:glycosyltransferase involved in cell wall biosynthesis
MVEENPLITTLIPTFQRPNLLKRAIFSALNQTYQNVRVYVFDNASTDDTEKVVEEFKGKDGRVFYFKHKTNISAPANFQYALDQVETPLFSILADDDLLLPSFYELAVEKLRNHPKAMFFVGSTYEITDEGKVLHVNASMWPEQEYFPAPDGALLMINHYINWTGCVFRKDILLSLQIDQRVKPIDYDFLTRACLRYPFVFSKKPCAFLILSNISYSFTSGLKLIWPSWKVITDNFLEECRDSPELQKKVREEMDNLLFHKLLGVFLSSLSNGDIDGAKRVLEILRENHPKHTWLYFLLESSCTSLLFRALLLALKAFRSKLKQNIVNRRNKIPAVNYPLK